VQLAYISDVSRQHYQVPTYTPTPAYMDC